jgi:AcrR family transcriptional regulator
MARRADHTRTELEALILDTANLIIGRDGPEGLTARRLAEAVGYAPGTIYNVFSSMEEVYLRINARTLDRLYALLSGPVCRDAKRTPVQNLKRMAVLYRNFAREERRYWLMLFSQNLPVSRHEQDWYQQRVDRLFHPLEELLTPFFGARQERRRRMAARILWASTHGLCFLEETGKMPAVEGAGFEDLSAMLIEGFIRGIKE